MPSDFSPSLSPGPALFANPCAVEYWGTSPTHCCRTKRWAQWHPDTLPCVYRWRTTPSLMTVRLTRPCSFRQLAARSFPPLATATTSQHVSSAAFPCPWTWRQTALPRSFYCDRATQRRAPNPNRVMFELPDGRSARLPLCSRSLPTTFQAATQPSVIMHPP